MRFFRSGELELSFTLAAALYIILGLFLVLFPGVSRTLLCMLLGAGITLYGLAAILPHLPFRGRTAYAPALLPGICALALGVFSLVNPAFLMNFLFTVLALFVLLASAMGILRALKLRSMGFMHWRAALAASLIQLLLALSILLMPGLYGNLLMMLCGLLLISSGVSDLVGLHYLSRLMRL